MFIAKIIIAILIICTISGVTIGTICSIKYHEAYSITTSLLGAWCIIGPIVAFTGNFATGINILLCLPWTVILFGIAVLPLVIVVDTLDKTPTPQ